MPLTAIRILAPDDWETFVPIRLEALKDNPSVFGSNYAAELKYTKQDWQDWLSQPVFALYENDTITGIISVVTDRDDSLGETAIICSVFIKPAYRGKGYSRLMYEACVDCAIRHKSWKKLIVSHRVDNLASRGAILRQGFVHTLNRPKTWQDNVTCNEVCYELDLEQLRKQQ